MEQIQQIPLSEIYPSEGNRRYGGFDPAKLQELADSIRAAGVLQPAVVRLQENGEGKYELVAGERRWRAAKLAGLQALPCVVREIDDVTVLKIQTIENLQREDIHPLDEADGYARLIDRAGYDVEHLAQEVGRSPSYVYQRLKLRDLVEPARKMLAEGKLTAGHGILIARLPTGQQKEVLGSWLFRRGEEVSVRQLDGFIHEHILLDLNKAAFKKDDPDLDLNAGPCTTCPKRTGYQPALFADVCNGNGGKRDYCTDPPCFNGKLEALVQRRRLELEESGEEHLKVADGYVDYREEQRLKKADVKERSGWEECKKKEEGAVQCLVVAGAGRGRLTWGRERKETRYGSYEPTVAEKKRRQQEKRDRQIKAAVRRRLWDAVTGELEAKGVYTTQLPVELLRMVALKAWDRTWDNLRSLYCKTMGWGPDEEKRPKYGNPWHEIGNAKIGEMGMPELRRFLVTCVLLIDDLDLPNFSTADCKTLKTMAALYQLDVGALETEVKQQFAEKAARATKKAAKAKGKKKAGASP